ncbi:hypothetical protein LL01C5_44600 [Escherichia coli]
MCAGGMMQDQNVREREVALNYVLWRDRWYQICVLEGKAENYMCTGGKNGWKMCAGGKVWANCGASPSSAHQKQEIGQAFPAAHIFLMQLPSSTHLFWEFQLWIARMDDYKTFPAFLLN